MKTSQKQRRKQLEKKLKERTYERDADGRVVINMTVRDDQDFLSTLSVANETVINDEVAEYLEYWTSDLLPSTALTLRIHSCCIDKQEEEIYRQAIGEYYTQDYINNEIELKKNWRLVVVLTILGVLTLFGMIVYDYYIGRPIWTEVIDIIAWVLLWEAVDIAVLENRHLKENRCRYLSYIDMNIEYVCEENKNE